MTKKYFIMLFVLLICACTGLRAQTERTIRGTVTDERNVPLVGVTISVPGTQIGTVTDVNGKFVLTLKSEVKASVVKFSFVGMKTQMIPMSKLTKATTIVMEEDTNVLDDVIVTGYQTISKERATGAFGTVRSEQLEAKLNSNLKNVMEISPFAVSRH